MASLTDSPDPLIQGTPLTLTADTVADVDGSPVLVEFYRDLDNDGVIDATDQLLGSDSSSTGGWSVVVPGTMTSLFPPGTAKYLARVQDNDGAWSATKSTTGIVNVPPVVVSMAASPDPVGKGDNLTLTALGVSDTVPGTVVSVTFYRDSNASGAWESTDTTLGTDSSSVGGWTWTGSTSAFPTGTVRLFARAKDNNNAYSDPVTTTVQVNSKPVIGTFTDSPDPLIQGQPLTLTAGSVTDPGGTLAQVEFYWDANNSGVIDAPDLLLGSDTSSTGGWSLVVPGATTASFPLGTAKYLARAQDVSGVWGVAKSTTGIVNVPPTVASFSVSPSPVNQGFYLTMTATEIADTAPGYVTTVEFYRDSNNNGALDPSTDSKLATGTVYADEVGSGPSGSTRPTSPAG